MLKAKKSRIMGKGCFTTTPLPKGKKIADYKGELIRGHRKIVARVLEQWKQRILKVVWLSESLAIDGAIGGDATAYLNHSCAPNAFVRRAPGNKMLIFALRDIDAGEEVTISYRDPNHPSEYECRCGASTCRSIRAGARKMPVLN